MKITEHIHKVKDTFGELNEGDVFIIPNEEDYSPVEECEKHFMKTNNDMKDGNAVCLNNGRMKMFNSFLIVEELNVEMIIYK